MNNNCRSKYCIDCFKCFMWIILWSILCEILQKEAWVFFGVISKSISFNQWFHFTLLFWSMSLIDTNMRYNLRFRWEDDKQRTDEHTQYSTDHCSCRPTTDMYALIRNSIRCKSILIRSEAAAICYRSVSALSSDYLRP